MSLNKKKKMGYTRRKKQLGKIQCEVINACSYHDYLWNLVHLPVMS